MSISPVIATHTDAHDPTGRNCWVFKIVNKSYFLAFDIRVEVLQSIPVPTTTGHYNYRHMPVQLVKSEFPHVAPYRPQWFKGKEYTVYALQFRTYENIEALLNSNNSCTIHVRVICRHALTGLGKVWNVKYTSADIKPGKYRPGNNFGIV